MTSFLIGGTVAVDAGAITRALTLAEQRAIRHVIITHTHIDHTSSLPFLIENLFGNDGEPVSMNHLYPSVRFQVIEPEVSFTIATPAGELEVTPVPVNHVVPTTGLLLRQNGSSLLFTSDTGPTERVWQVANAADDLSAVITECSFPNRLQAVADASLHLTPQTLAGELAKLTRAVAVYLYHFKPPYLDELRAELTAATLPHPVTELVQDRTYTF